MFRNTLFALLLSFSSSEIAFAADPRPAWRVAWDKTVTAAEKEGSVAIYIFEAGPLTEETVQGFERAHPKIPVARARQRSRAAFGGRAARR